MAFGKLFGSQGNPRTEPILAIAKANNIELEFVQTSPASTENEYRKINKLGKIPTFVGSNGFVLHETIAICIYVASQNEKTTLLGKTKEEYATILKWLSYFNSEIPSTHPGWLYPRFGFMPYNKKTCEESLAKLFKLLEIVEDWLLSSTFLAGERITVADVFCANIISIAFKYVLDNKWQAANPCITRWFKTVVNQPIYSDVCQAPTFIDEYVEYQPPKKEAAPKAVNAAKKQKASKKKEDKDEEEPEDDAPAAPREKHPLEALPKATLALDEWKRKYSNSETPEALKWFWENHKPEEYSLWKLEYKYNEELTQIFMSSNLIGGFFARLEASRKYIFGAASVYGVKDNSIIQGAFLIRGQDAAPAFDVAPDFESYELTKLDPSKEEDKQFINDQWTWEKPITVNGKDYAWADGKVFK